jgi:hypothetical protein
MSLRSTWFLEVEWAPLPLLVVALLFLAVSKEGGLLRLLLAVVLGVLPPVEVGVRPL